MEAGRVYFTEIIHRRKHTLGLRTSFTLHYLSNGQKGANEKMFFSIGNQRKVNLVGNNNNNENNPNATFLYSFF